MNVQMKHCIDKMMGNNNWKYIQKEWTSSGKTFKCHKESYIHKSVFSRIIYSASTKEKFKKFYKHVVILN